MKEKTATLLHAHVADSFKREADADEAIWRSLPFFAAITVLGVAVLPSVFSSVAESPTGWARIVGWGFFSCCMAAFGIAGSWFWRVIKLREYVYPPNDAAILAYAEALSHFHESDGLSSERADAATVNDVRDFVLREFANATSNNRRNNSAKAAARSRVLLWVVVGFMLAFCSEATILIGRAFSDPTSNAGSQGHGRQGTAAQGTDSGAPLERRSQAGTTAFGARLGGGELLSAHSSAQAGALMNDEAPKEPPTRPEPPRPPEPERYKKNEEVPKRRS